MSRRNAGLRRGSRGAFLLVLCVAACGDGPAAPGGTPGDSLPSVVDTAQGIDLSPIRSVVFQIDRGQAYAGIHSLLIQRNDSLVIEEYFGSSSVTDIHTLQSVTKSVASALVGIAIRDGWIDSVNEPVADFFPQWRDELFQDPRRAAMTVQDILTMRTGTDYHESGANSPHAQLNSLATGWDRFWLERPMVADPGTTWQYDSGGAVTLSSMLKQRTGMHADAYADSVLFGPMGITELRWSRNAEGHPHTGGGLFLTARDVMKFGQLYLRRGRWGDRQIVPESWVDESTRRSSTPTSGLGWSPGYGYLWWLLGPDPAGDGTTDIFAAAGYRGQRIFVAPEHDLVVVVTGWFEPGAAETPMTLFRDVILPAVLR